MFFPSIFYMLKGKQHSSVGKVLFTQALGHETHSPKSHLKSLAKLCAIVILILGHENRWIPGACWPHITTKSTGFLFW